MLNNNDPPILRVSGACFYLKCQLLPFCTQFSSHFNDKLHVSLMNYGCTASTRNATATAVAVSQSKHAYGYTNYCGNCRCGIKSSLLSYDGSFCNKTGTRKTGK